MSSVNCNPTMINKIPMPSLKAILGLSLATATVIALGSTAQALTLEANDSYYTFRGNVSANSGIRLLVDKATVIGLSPQDTFSFLKFDQADFPSSLTGKKYKAVLTLQQDISLASNLIPASDARPLSVSVYNLTAPFNDVTGNIPDVDYGIDGVNAIATTLVGNNGLYDWDITALVENWLTDPSSNNGLALSGLFGNIDTDGRNSYGIFHTVGSTTGLPPTLQVTIVPEPSNLWGLVFLGSGFVLIRCRRRH